MKPSAKQPPAILQLVPTLRSGGVERGTIEMARAIINKGWRAYVASSGGPMVAQLERLGAVHITLPLHKRHPWHIWRNSKHLKNIIEMNAIDIVHARSRGPAWSGWLATKKTSARFITTFHGFYGLQNRAKQRYNSIMVRGDRVIAISYFIAKHIKEYYVVDSDRVRVIHRGVDLQAFNANNVQPRRMMQLSDSWHLPEDLPLILFPGRLTRWKGQTFFLEALAAMPHRNFFAVLLGDDNGHPAYRQDIEKLIEAKELQGCVRLAENTSLMPEAYTLAHVVAATSTAPEAFGRVPVEAMAMGRPVIATNHGGACETVVEGETGWLVAPDDITQLTKALTHALSLTDSQWQTMSEACMRRAQEFSITTMCDATLDTYAALLPTTEHKK